MRDLSSTSVIDRKHIKKRQLFRLYSIVLLSGILLLILNPKLMGTSMAFNKISLLVIWFLCAIDGVKILYDVTGPVLSKSFVSRLNSDYYAVYLRSFLIEKDNVINKTENFLCEILEKSIPVFAIGNPSEVLSKIGAERLYASDNDWEKMIVDLIKKCNLIIVRPSNSNGCLIELKHIVNHNLLDKCLFVVTSKEELLVLCNHLDVKRKEGLELFANNFFSNSVYGLKINANGRYSSFIFDTTNDNLKNFLVFYGIDIDKGAKPINLSSSQLTIDRLIFILNPLFYSSLYKWNLFQKCIVSFFMASPILLVYIFQNGYNHKLLLFYTITVIFAFTYSVIKAPYISQTRNQFASATHYMTRTYFLLYLNMLFIFALIISFFTNHQFANICLTLIKVSLDFIMTLSLFFYYFLRWPLLLVVIIILLYLIRKKIKK